MNINHECQHCGEENNIEIDEDSMILDMAIDRLEKLENVECGESFMEAIAAGGGQQ